MEKRNFNIEELIGYLTGTCKSLQEAMQDLFDLDEDDLRMEDHEKIDAEIFRCETCDWWFEVDEQAESGECIECFNDFR